MANLKQVTVACKIFQKKRPHNLRGLEFLINDLNLGGVASTSRLLSAATIAARAHWLECNANVGFAIWFALLNSQTTEPKIFGCWIANRPFACALCQFHQSQLLRFLFNFIDLGQSLWANFIC